MIEFNIFMTTFKANAQSLLLDLLKCCEPTEMADFLNQSRDKDQNFQILLTVNSLKSSGTLLFFNSPNDFPSHEGNYRDCIQVLSLPPEALNRTYTDLRTTIINVINFLDLLQKYIIDVVKPKNKDDIKPRIPLPFMDGILAINFNYWDKEKLLRSLADVPDTPTPRSLPVSHPRFPTNIIFRARPEPNQNQFPVRLKVHPPFLSASTRSPATPPSRDSPLPTPITPSFPGAWRSPSTFAPAAGGVSAIKP